MIGGENKKWLRRGLVASICFVVAIVASIGFRQYSQYQLVERIRDAGGDVTFHRPGPVRSSLGPWFDPPLVSVYVGNGRDPDAVLRHAADLRRVDNLWIIGTRVTPRGLKHLEELGPVSLLSVQSTPMTDSDLPFIARMKKLKCLQVARTSATREGLRSLLQSLPDLRILDADDLLVAHERPLDMQNIGE